MQYQQSAVGETIQRLRMEKNMSQELLSGLAGIARTHLSMIETGRKQANFETIWRLALALELRPSELVAEIEQTCCRSHRQSCWRRIEQNRLGRGGALSPNGSCKSA